MELKIVLLGYELARIELDLGEQPEPQKVSPVDKATKAVSRWWVGKMVR